MKAKHILILFLFLASNFKSSSQKLIMVWETPKNLQTPESVIYDEANDIIYASNMGSGGQEKNGDGFISKISISGKIKNLKWITGLNGPTGMGIFGNKLYVADIDQLVVIDIENSKILEKYDVPGAGFLNDVTVRMNGDVFISDSNLGKIYIIENGKVSIWLESNKIININGLMAEQGKLLVGGNSVYDVDLVTKEVKVIVEEGGGIDGIERDNKGRLVFSNWAGRIFMAIDGKPVKLIDTSNEKINSADIDFAFKPGLLLVPTFSDNRVIAYKIVD